MKLIGRTLTLFLLFSSTYAEEITSLPVVLPTIQKPTPIKPQVLDLNITNIRNILRDIPATIDEIKLKNSSIFMSGWSGNGGDNEVLKDNIWYLGDTPVKYCVKVSDDFRLSQTDASEMIRTSFNKWISFFKKYDLTAKELSSKKFQLPFEAPKKLSTNFQEVTCEELKESNSGEELVFLLGKSNPLIDLYKDVSTESAYGLALRKGYNHKTLRNSGFIWIKNELTPKQAEHMILHEIGHLFGMKHDSVYVMDTDVTSHLEKRNASLGSIESPNWKYHFIANQEHTLTLKKNLSKNKFFGRNNCKRNEIANNKLPKKLKKLLGSYGCTSAKVVVKEIINNKNTKLEIQFNSNRGKSIKMEGTFKSSRTVPKESIYPGIFTRVQSLKKRARKFRKLTLGSRFDLPARGIFQTRRLSLPARIDIDKGIQVEIFLPSNKWWVLK